LHKLILTSVIAFLPFQWQLAVAMIVVCFYASSMYVAKPYLRKSDDRLQLVALTEIILLLMSGNVLNQVPYDDIMDLVLSILLIGIVILFFAFFMLQGILLMYNLIKGCIKARRAKEEADSAATDRRLAGEDDDGADVVLSGPLPGSASVDDLKSPTSTTALAPPSTTDSAGSIAGSPASMAGHKRAQSAMHARGASVTHSQWVADYKAGVDLTAPQERAKPQVQRVDSDTALVRNPLWNPVAGVELGSASTLSTDGTTPVASPQAAPAPMASQYW